MRVIDLGVCDYHEAYLKQIGFVEDRYCEREKEDLLVFVEHPEVYTFGRKYKAEIPFGLKNVQTIERGGDATYHNPGQVVCYPIMKLHEEKRDLHLYLRFLEASVIRVLEEFGIRGEARPNKTGVWIEGKEKKIASIGVAVKHWVTYHGLALNVNNDLTGFSRINPCGFEATVMTSMQKELQKFVSTQDVKDCLIKHFV